MRCGWGEWSGCRSALRAASPVVGEKILVFSSEELSFFVELWSFGLSWSSHRAPVG